MNNPRIFQQLLEAAPDAFIISDAEGHIVMANSMVRQVLGYEPEELIGREIDILLQEHLRERHRQYRKNFITVPSTRPMGSGIELIALRKDGSTFPAEISLSPLVMENFS